MKHTFHAFSRFRTFRNNQLQLNQTTQSTTQRNSHESLVTAFTLRDEISISAVNQAGHHGLKPSP